MKPLEKISRLGRPVVVAWSVALGLAGCGGLGQPPLPREEVVKQRSDAFWQARMRDDALAAYAFTSPSYRQLYKLEQFQIDYAGRSMARERSVHAVTCDDATQVCTVKQRMVARFPFLGNVDTEVFVDEYWLYDQGQWWVFKK